MSQQLRVVIAETQEKFRLDPTSAITHFESSSCLQQGLQSQARMRQHTLVVDEPEALGGADTGPNPVEIVLAALGTCQEITYRAYATALGIPLERISVVLDGEVDLRGFLGVPPNVRPGYRHGDSRLQRAGRAAGETPRGSQCSLPRARHHHQQGPC